MDQPLTTPVIDPDAWALYMRPLGEAADEIVEIWQRELDRRVAAIADAAGRRDEPALADAAHTLRSSATYVGAARLAAACGRVERALAGRETWDVIDAEVPTIRREAFDASHALRTRAWATLS